MVNDPNLITVMQEAVKQLELIRSILFTIFILVGVGVISWVCSKAFGKDERIQ